MNRGLDWKEQRKKALERDYYTCRKCWKKTKSVHHIIPYRISHDNHVTNLLTECEKCHIKTENDFRKYGLITWMRRQIVVNKRLLKVSDK